MFVWLCIDWSSLDSTASAALNAKEIELKVLNLETAPLRGIEKRLVSTQEQIDSFYSDAFPPTTRQSQSGLASWKCNPGCGFLIFNTRRAYPAQT